MGLFKRKPTSAPIPLEQRPIQYLRFPCCKHRADDEDCGCYAWNVQIGKTYGIDETADSSLLPSRRGSTKRTLVLLPESSDTGDWIPFTSPTGEAIGHVHIRPAERGWASSDDTRLVYQVWLIVTRVDEDPDDEADYAAQLRFAKKGQLLFFDEGDEAAFVVG